MIETPIDDEVVEKLGYYIKRDLKVFSHDAVDDAIIEEMVDKKAVTVFLDDVKNIRFVRCFLYRNDGTHVVGLIEPKSDWPT